MEQNNLSKENQVRVGSSFGDASSRLMNIFLIQSHTKC